MKDVSGDKQTECFPIDPIQTRFFKNLVCFKEIHERQTHLAKVASRIDTVTKRQGWDKPH